MKLAGVLKQGNCHTFRHSFATHLLERRYDIRNVVELLAHKDVKTAGIYTQVVKKQELYSRWRLLCNGFVLFN